MKAVFAQVCKDNHISRQLASAALQNWWTESRETPDLRNTLFAVINSFTRAGQQQENETWVRFDILGGNLASLDLAGWDALVSRAAKLKLQEVDKSFARWTFESVPTVGA
jgi:hypothetical protein